MKVDAVSTYYVQICHVTSFKVHILDAEFVFCNLSQGSCIYDQATVARMLPYHSNVTGEQQKSLSIETQIT